MTTPAVRVLAARALHAPESIADHPGTCPCGAAIRKGDLIAKVGGAWCCSACNTITRGKP